MQMLNDGFLQQILVGGNGEDVVEEYKVEFLEIRAVGIDFLLLELVKIGRINAQRLEQTLEVALLNVGVEKECTTRFMRTWSSRG